MKDPQRFIRKAIIDRLTNRVCIDGEVEECKAYYKVYNRVPSNAPDFYIKVYGVENTEVDQNNTSFASQINTRIETVTRFNADDGGELDVNIAMDQVLELVRTRSIGPNKEKSYFDLSSEGFNVYTSTNQRIHYIIEDTSDHTYYKAILELNNRVEQIN